MDITAVELEAMLEREFQRGKITGLAEAVRKYAESGQTVRELAIEKLGIRKLVQNVEVSAVRAGVRGAGQGRVEGKEQSSDATQSESGAVGGGIRVDGRAEAGKGRRGEGETPKRFSKPCTAHDRWGCPTCQVAKGGAE